ncbi:MAG: dual specificity protein phosphatase family protein [Pirellulales bacterium]|nr:dual specificity protein phosphatase family protein [Pirellulales bacterium]
MKAEVYFIAETPGARLAIMPRPRGGDWLIEEIVSWRRSGIDVVVSLLENSEIEEFELQEEGSSCEAMGIKFLRFPISDRGVPDSPGQVSILVSRLVEILHKGQGVGIHCRMGIGRSSLIAACVLVSLGHDIEAAWESITKARGFPVPDTNTQRDWVAEWTTLH